MEKIEKVTPVLVQAFTELTLVDNWSAEDKKALASAVWAQLQGQKDQASTFRIFSALDGIKAVVCAIARERISNMFCYPATIGFDCEHEYDDQGGSYRVYTPSISVNFPEKVRKALRIDGCEYTLSYQMYDPSELYAFESESHEFSEDDLKVLWAVFGFFGTEEELIERLGENGEAEFAPTSGEIEAYDDKAISFGELLESLAYKSDDPFRCGPTVPSAEEAVA